MDQKVPKWWKARARKVFWQLPFNAYPILTLPTEHHLLAKAKAGHWLRHTFGLTQCGPSYTPQQTFCITIEKIMNKLARGAGFGGFCKLKSVKTTNFIRAAIAKMANDHKPPLPWPRQGFAEQVFHPICFCGCPFEQSFPVKMSSGRGVYCMTCSCFSMARTRNVYHTCQC